MSENIFYTKDVLERNVKLTKTQLYTHILGKGGHVDIALDLSSVAKTVEDPDYIYESKSRNQRNLYFKSGSHRYFSRSYVKVVVDFTNPSEGNVITSHTTRTVSRGLGRLIYEKSTAI